MTKNNILVPIDFSKQSHIALGQSYNLANSRVPPLYCCMFMMEPKKIRSRNWIY